MSHRIRHRMSFRLANGSSPQLPSYLSDYIQFDPGLNQFQIRGDISGAPTPDILDSLIEQGIQLRSPLWSFSLQGDANHACAFALNQSASGDRRDVQLLNNSKDLQDGSVAPFHAKLRSGCDAVLSKKPQGPFSLVANNLLVSDAALETLGLTRRGAVRVNSERIGWHIVDPDSFSVLDASLCFTASDNRPYRSHLVNIAKRDAKLTFGVAVDTERWGEKLSAEIYLIDVETAAPFFSESKTVFGDVALTPVFPHDSPEAELMYSVTKRANRLPIANACR